MTAAIDLDAYFRRIGHSGERTATLDTLRDIHRRHTEAIPFENLNPLLRWPVRLDPASLRVLWNAPEGAIPPRGHVLLRIDLDRQPYIADAGFGAMTLTGPLKLEPHVEQATPHEPFRLVPAGDEFLLQAKIQEAWKALYRFGLQQQFPVDYEVTNWYLSNHPASRFVTGLIAARPAADRRYALPNNELAIHHLNGGTDRRVLTSATELRDVLAGPFRITLPDAPELDTALARITVAAA